MKCGGVKKLTPRLLMSIEGGVVIQLSTHNYGVEEVVIASQRPVLAQKLLEGKGASEVPSLVAMVYRLCGRAQTFASAMALEQAIGNAASEEAMEVRLQLVRMEVIREHLWRILLDWPKLMNMPSKGNLMKQVLAFDKDWASALDGKNNIFQLGSTCSAVEKSKASKVAMLCGTFLKEHVFSMSPQTFYACHDVDQLLLWAQYTQTGAARFIHALIQQEMADIGQASVNVLPELDEAWLIQKLGGADAEKFVSRPSMDETTYETTPLSRQFEHPLIQAVVNKFGHGLLARFIAVLLEVAETFVDLVGSLFQAKNPLVQSPQRRDGLGSVEAARGRLIHHVELEDDEVKTYHIIAPTEWNFHPNGVLKSALRQLKGDIQSIEKQAGLLIHAMDPCVQFTLDVQDA